MTNFNEYQTVELESDEKIITMMIIRKEFMMWGLVSNRVPSICMSLVGISIPYRFN